MAGWVRKRFSEQFQLEANYVLSWDYDDDSNERNFSGIVYQDAYNLASEYSWSRIDIRHRWVFSSTWDTPWSSASLARFFQ